MKEKRKGRVTRVESYSGYTRNERPVAFYLGPRRIRVRRVMQRRRSPDFEMFRVEAEDGLTYRLTWDRDDDRWLVWEEAS